MRLSALGSVSSRSSLLQRCVILNTVAVLRISKLTRTRTPSQLSGDAIEQISLFAGPTVAGLLNASFGNVIEIIVGVTALLRDEFQIVQTAVRALPYFTVQLMLITRRCLALSCTTLSLS